MRAPCVFPWLSSRQGDVPYISMTSSSTGALQSIHAHGRTTCISIYISDLMPRRAECEQVHAGMPSLTVRGARHSHIYVQIDRHQSIREICMDGAVARRHVQRQLALKSVTSDMLMCPTVTRIGWPQQRSGDVSSRKEDEEEHGRIRSAGNEQSCKSDHV